MTTTEQHRFRFCRRRHGRFAVYLTFTPLERLFGLFIVPNRAHKGMSIHSELSKNTMRLVIKGLKDNIGTGKETRLTHKR